MSLAVRVIPCLDVDAGRVVKGVNFVGLRDAGDPVELARRYDEQGADELTFLDITASSRGAGDDLRRRAPHRRAGVHPAHRRWRGAHRRRRRRAAARGSGQGRRQHRRHRPSGTARRDRRPVRPPGARAVGGRPPRPRPRPASRSPPTAAAAAPASTRSAGRRQAAELGAGEILLNSMDADGTKDGYDLALIAVGPRAAVGVPVIASGGAGERRRLRARPYRPAPTRCSQRACSTSAS